MTPTAQPPTGEPRIVSLANLFPWEGQPRPQDQISEETLVDILPSIRAKGVMQSLLVRPIVDRPGDFWIVAGERRFQAARLAGVRAVPVLVRELSDFEALSYALDENHKRKDLHPMDEARALARLQLLDPACNDLDVLAAEVHQDRPTVRKKLKLLTLDPVVIAAFEAKAIKTLHAERIADLPVARHREALVHCFGPFLLPADATGTIDELIEKGAWFVLSKACESFRAFERYLAATTLRDLHVPEIQQDMPDLAEQIADFEAELEAEEASLVKLSVLPDMSSRQAKALGVIARHRWIEIVTDVDIPVKKGDPLVTRDRCESMRVGIVLHGDDAGAPPRPVTYCSKRGCPVHWPRKSSLQTPEEIRSAERKARAIEKQLAAARDWDRMKPAARHGFVEQLRKKLPRMLTVARTVLPKAKLAQLHRDFGVRLTDERSAVLVLVLAHVSTSDPAAFAKFAKPFGFNLSTFTKQHVAETPSGRGQAA